MSQLLSEALEIHSALATTTAGTSDVTGSIIDMLNAESVLFVAKFGTAAANNSIKAQQDADSAMGAAADLAGSKVVVGSSDEIVWLEIFEPQERYVRAVAVRGTSTTLDWCVATVRLKKLPADNITSGTITGQALISPAEGAA
jgi:Na+/H+ antiporter NhaD/arsenite permease-like protein